jgi:threonine dehydrogenase-like Zn-dependent dehydrogenase
MKTLAAKVTKPKTIETMEISLPDLGKDDVLIEVLSCGVCSTEMAVYEGKTIGVHGVSFHYKSFPADLGHEVVGYVIEKGSNVSKFKIDDCVTGLTYSGCGFAKHFVENQNSLIKINEIEKNKHHLCIGEPLMATVNIINQISPIFGDTVSIIGDGFMSLLLIAGLSKFPLDNLIVVGHHDSRLKMASKLGATKIINSKHEDPWKSIMEITSNNGVDSSVEYAGNPDSLRLSASVCKAKQQAKLVLAASYPNDMPFTISNYLQNRAPVITPAYPHHSKNKSLDLARGIWGLSKGIFPMSELITHKYSLENAQKAFEDNKTKEGNYIKGIIMPNNN